MRSLRNLDLVQLLIGHADDLLSVVEYPLAVDLNYLQRLRVVVELPLSLHPDVIGSADVCEPTVTPTLMAIGVTEVARDEVVQRCLPPGVVARSIKALRNVSTSLRQGVSVIYEETAGAAVA